MSMQTIAETIPQADIPAIAPVANVGIDLSTALVYNTMRPEKWLITAVVTVAPSDLTVWGALAAGVIADASDDRWGLHNDRYGRVIAGKIGTALAVGTHHFIVSELGVYSRIYFQKSAGTVNVFVTPILESKRSS